VGDKFDHGYGTGTLAIWDALLPSDHWCLRPGRTDRQLETKEVGRGQAGILYRFKRMRTDRQQNSNNRLLW